MQGSNFANLVLGPLVVCQCVFWRSIALRLPNLPIHNMRVPLSGTLPVAQPSVDLELWRPPQFVAPAHTASHDSIKISVSHRLDDASHGFDC